MELWIAGEFIEGEPWGFVGVFDTEAAAVAACKDERYFVGPATLNVASPVEKEEWPGCYAPLLKVE